MKKAMLCLMLVAVSSCTTVDKTQEAHWIDPSQAVQLAAASPRLGVAGVFALTVKATGKTDRTHLNSEVDYRDQRNLSIAISPSAAADLETQLGAPAEISLRGKRILVVGTARRVRIDFVTDDGKPTGKYYYQTHVDVTKASQIKVL